MRLLTAKEVAELLHCSVSLVRRADMKHRLGALYISARGLRFREDLVERFILDQEPPERPTELEARPRRARKIASRHGLW